MHERIRIFEGCALHRPRRCSGMVRPGGPAGELVPDPKSSMRNGLREYQGIQGGISYAMLMNGARSYCEETHSGESGRMEYQKSLTGTCMKSTPTRPILRHVP